MAVDIIARGLAVQRPPSYIYVENYSALPADPIINQLYYTLNSQGTYGLPGTGGGTYHPAGPYIYDGGEGKYMDSTMAATQEEVNAGMESYKFVSPNTLANTPEFYNVSIGMPTGDEAYSGGNHAGLYSLLNHTHSNYLLTSDSRISNGDTAYSGGNHSDANYVTGTPGTSEGYLTTITKLDVESVLTGEVESHSHPTPDALIIAYSISL